MSSTINVVLAQKKEMHVSTNSVSLNGNHHANVSLMPNDSVNVVFSQNKQLRVVKSANTDNNVTLKNIPTLSSILVYDVETNIESLDGGVF